MLSVFDGHYRLRVIRPDLLYSDMAEERSCSSGSVSGLAAGGVPQGFPQCIFELGDVIAAD